MSRKVRPAKGSGPNAGETRVRLALVVQYAVSARTLPPRAALRRWARAALDGDTAVTIRFVGAREGQRLNAQFRGRDYATNVLTFVYDDGLPLCGDLVLCAPVLRREAREQERELADHIAHLVVHGMLHLQGFDHATSRTANVMERREATILAALGIPDPYAIPRGRRRATPVTGAHPGDGTTASRALRNRRTA